LKERRRKSELGNNRHRKRGTEELRNEEKNVVQTGDEKNKDEKKEGKCVLGVESAG
jgi:hypothetical protein